MPFRQLCILGAFAGGRPQPAAAAMGTDTMMNAETPTATNTNHVPNDAPTSSGEDDSSLWMRQVRMALRLVICAAALVTSGVLASACGGPDWPQCENDDHCEENDDDKAMNFVCVFGQCQECGRDADCKGGKKCRKNRCTEPCKSDNQCGKGLACNVKTGDCVKASKVRGKKGDKCMETGDCQSGFVCFAQKCMTNDEAKAEKKKQDAASKGDGSSGSVCVETGDCKSGLVCFDAKCMSEEEAEMAAAAAAAAGGEICGDMRVFFAFNLHDLNPEAREILDGIAKCLTNNAGKKIRIGGHADERGTTQYNLDLGDKRARTIKKYMVSLGVNSSRVSTVSFGEEKPLEAASNEDAWSKNRRAEVAFK